MKQILIIEDDKTLSDGIVLALKSNEYEMMQAFNLAEARKKDINKLNLIIMDINLPDGNGLTLLKEIRQNSRLPIILLTANDMEIDIVTGLEMGADDYITKPFSLAVLRARVNARLRSIVTQNTEKINIGPFQFDFDLMEFLKNGVSIELSKTEQKLLKRLVVNQSKTIERSELVDRIWTDGAEYVDENALSVTIKRLRDKLEDNPAKPEYIKTVYGIGYKFQGEE